MLERAAIIHFWLARISAATTVFHDAGEAQTVAAAILVVARARICRGTGSDEVIDVGIAEQKEHLKPTAPPCPVYFCGPARVTDRETPGHGHLAHRAVHGETSPPDLFFSSRVFP